MQHVSIDRNLSTYLKGIGIIIMVMWHSFDNPDWYASTISYPYLLPYTKEIGTFGGFAVVAMFMFLTGYTYYFHKDKSCKYSLRKISVFLLDYWIVLFSLVALAAYFCDYIIRPLNILQEMFSFKREVMLFSWYILMYIEIMFFLPFLHWTLENYRMKKAALIIIIIFIVVFLVQEVLKIYDLRGTVLYEIVSHDFMKSMPMAILGYLMAKYDLFSRLYEKIGKNNLYYIICLTAFLAYHLVSKQNIICTPLWILFLYKLNLSYNKYIQELILLLGRHSMNIWFFQCIFFGAATREVFQPLGFLPYYPPLVVMWILFLCMLASLVFTPAQRLFQPKVEALFK